LTRSTLVSRIISIAIAASLVAAWQIAVRRLDVPSYLIPAPSDIVVALRRGFERGTYWPHLISTLHAMGVGYVVGCGLGILLGALVAEFKIVERLVYPYIVALQSLPKIALAPLFVMWFGYGYTSKVVTVALICFFPLMVNTMTGVLATQADRLDMVRTMTATRLQLFWHVKLPSAAGHVFAGLQVAIVLALIGALVAEFIGGEQGLGNLIEIEQSSLDTAGVFAVLVLLAVIGMTATALMRLLHTRIVFWEAEPTRTQETDVS
jgi:NitT/TauT family transport system permease protein